MIRSPNDGRRSTNSTDTSAPESLSLEPKCGRVRHEHEDERRAVVDGVNLEVQCRNRRVLHAW